MRKKFSPDKTLAYSAGIGDLLNLCQNLNQTNIGNQDKNGRTVLHYAAEYGKPNIALMMVDIILNAFFVRETTNPEGSKSNSNHDLTGLNVPKMSLSRIQLLRHTYPDALQDLLDCQDVNGDTAIHLAAGARNPSVVTKLITAGANLKLTNQIGETSLLLVYKHAPTALKAAYDRSIESGFTDITDEDITYEIDFSSIVESHEDFEKLRPESKMLYKYISNIRKRPTKELFNHPLIQIFIDLKWRKIRVFLWISLIFHMIWLSVYSSLITYVYIRKCPFKGEIYRGDFLPIFLLNSTTTERYNDVSQGSDKVLCRLKYSEHYGDLVVLMTVFSGIILINKIFELRASKSCKFCCLNLENFCQIVMILVMFHTLIPVIMASVQGHYAHEHFGELYILAALGIFLAWLLMFWQFKKFPTMALHIEIWGNVMKGFATFMATFASLLLAFAFAFQILLPSEPRHNDFFFNFMRLFVMMAGEIGFDTFFFADNVSENLPFPQTTKFVYTAFVIMVSIILFNLLVSMTVSDTQELRKSGTLRRFASQLESIYFVEHFLFNSMFQFCAKRLLNRLQITSQLDQSFKRNVCLKDIPWHLHDGLKKVASQQNEMNETTREPRKDQKTSKYYEAIGKQDFMHSTFEIFDESDPALKQEIYKEASFDSNETTLTDNNDESCAEISNL